MAFRYATEKETDDFQDKWAEIAQTWLAKGFDHFTVADGIGRKTGLMAGTKDGTVKIQSGNRILTVTKDNIEVSTFTR